jgi:hypothetical protein
LEFIYVYDNKQYIENAGNWIVTQHDNLI